VDDGLDRALEGLEANLLVHDPETKRWVARVGHVSVTIVGAAMLGAASILFTPVIGAVGMGLLLGLQVADLAWWRRMEALVDGPGQSMVQVGPTSIRVAAGPMPWEEVRSIQRVSDDRLELDTRRGPIWMERGDFTTPEAFDRVERAIRASIDAQHGEEARAASRDARARLGRIQAARERE
jgi:hypothetical protein